MDLIYFNSGLSNPKLHVWFSSYIYNRSGVKNIVKFVNNEFHVVFLGDSKDFTIGFKSTGRKAFFEKRKCHFFIIDSTCEFLLYYSKQLPKNGLACYGISGFDWFLNIPNNNSIYINYDFASYAIWALNRIEEIDVNSSDKHDRFQISNSHLFVDLMYLRPIIDEWFLFIFNILKDKGFIIKNSHFDFEISHDIDVISRYKQVPIIHRFLKFFKDAFFNYENLLSYIKNPTIFVELENANNLEYLMCLSDSIKTKSKFYFIVGNSSFRYDYRYYISSVFLFSLISKIILRGHEVGIHYSYNSSKKMLIKREWLYFSNYCKSLGYQIQGGRMHYLRINFLETLTQLADAGQVYDNSLTFHEYGGFRCGTCFPYKPYNFISQNEINIEVRPLILMDDSVLNYMNFSDIEKAFDYVKNLIDSCKDVNGIFSILWHNSNLDSEFKLSLYKRILIYLNLISNE
jgi:hypothetical protein